MMSRAVRISTMVAMLFPSMLIVFLVRPDASFVLVETTAIATLSLFVSLPLVDSVLFGSSVRPETAGICMGLPIGFFVRQSLVSNDLAVGAERVLMSALFLSLCLGVARLWRRRQRA